MIPTPFHAALLLAALSHTVILAAPAATSDVLAGDELTRLAAELGRLAQRPPTVAPLHDSPRSVPPSPPSPPSPPTHAAEACRTQPGVTYERVHVRIPDLPGCGPPSDAAPQNQKHYLNLLRATKQVEALKRSLLAAHRRRDADDENTEETDDEGVTVEDLAEDGSTTEIIPRRQRPQQQHNHERPAPPPLTPTNSASSDTPFRVDRRSGATLSFREFYEEYAVKRRPVIITDYFPRMFSPASSPPTPASSSTSSTWNMDYFRKHCGHVKAEINRRLAGVRSWAGLTMTGPTMPLRDYIDQVKAGTVDPSLYLFDLSLPLKCPAVMKEFTVPKYFAGDFLQRCRHRTSSKQLSKLSNYWPSLFIGRKGQSSALHVDGHGTHFWMAALQGRKQWVFYPPEDIPLLDEYAHEKHFGVDAFDPEKSAKKFPLYRCVVGETLCANCNFKFIKLLSLRSHKLTT